MFKLYLTCFIVCFWVINTIAQKKQNVYFLKNDGRYVTKKEDADFVRVVQEPDSGSVLYNVLEYYPNGNSKTIGKSKTIDPIMWEGFVNSYYSNKKRKRFANYYKTHSFSAIYDYYPNGKLYRYIESSIRRSQIATDLIFLLNEKIHTVNDSAGIPTVTDGNGYYKIYDQDFKYVKEEGAVKNSKRNGIWKGFSGQGQLIFTEEFEDGKFLKGTRTNEKGDVVKYRVKEALPTYENTLDGFSRYLSRTLHYPESQMPQDLQGNVIASFVVDQSGSVSNIKILKGLSKEIDKEVTSKLNVVKRWNPAMQNGVPIPIEIVFSLNFIVADRLSHYI
ncbi:MAG: TonB family protein, partial [Sphingobacteriaceae bacterium]